MKIDELIHILGSLKAEGLQEIDFVRRMPDMPWYELVGPRFKCSIPDESNKSGEPSVELTLRKPITLHRETASGASDAG